jgi:hypothetical protein
VAAIRERETETAPAVDEPARPEPFEATCPHCSEAVIAAYVEGELVVAERFEWEPRAACYLCSTIEARGQKRGQCTRCGSTSYVGEQRPKGRMLAVDVAWSDEGGVRVIGPRTSRRRGEGLYRLHRCYLP